MTEDEKKILEWLSSNDTGISSKSLAFEYLGTLNNNVDAPRDPSDLGRCLRLIKIVPDVRKCVDSLATKHLRWAKAAKVWEQIAKSMEEEVGIDWSKGERAAKTYTMMKEAGL